MIEKLTPHRFSFTAMASPCALHLYSSSQEYAKSVADKVIEEIRRFEKKYSRYQPDSVVTKINESAGKQAITVDVETAALLNYANVTWAESDGLFDITSGCLRRIWNFKEKIIPSQEIIEQTLANIGWEHIQWSGSELYLPIVGMELDFGGFGKEYAADIAGSLCRKAGIEHGLIDLGGDLVAIGPHPDGSAWKVGIRNPNQPGQAATIVELYQGGLATSGDYERGFSLNGRYYSHILNPKTGWPVEGFASVTVIADQALIAGTATTVAMLKGIEKGKAWLEELKVKHLCIERR
ncbi:FAD:protein FMN transferase [Marinibactrum halimedae]|uniref:FAD:protein FMN transferase n=1 Tax=Marinibactrum halimedae TaxID=1444977 RepID=A0AA37WKA9_9GAMM|nr:FAD:protein FMN transferase [Marinibactrum halimedae]MCD9460263.1 FAD:protein FMN transferase [Marinibactrum halimedae]GLS24349.1 FAD:protein FMN transferase [Marinibactrum halimedae]